MLESLDITMVSHPVLHGMKYFLRPIQGGRSLVPINDMVAYIVLGCGMNMSQK